MTFNSGLYLTSTKFFFSFKINQLFIFFSQNFKTFNSIIWYHQALLPVSPYFNNTCLSLWRSKMMMWHYTRIKFKKKKRSDEEVLSLCAYTCALFFQSRSETLLCGSSLLFLRKRGCATGSEAGGGRNAQEVK